MKGQNAGMDPILCSKFIIVTAYSPWFCQPTIRKEPGRATYLPRTAEPDAIETREWPDSLMCSERRPQSARSLGELTLYVKNGVKPPFTATHHTSTRFPRRQSLMPGSSDIERRIKSFVRWNAAACVREQ
jgi:hypothetical protein